MNMLFVGLGPMERRQNYGNSWLSVGETCPATEVIICIQIGFLWMQEHPIDWPTMAAVVFMLANE